MPHYLVFFPPDLDKQCDNPGLAGHGSAAVTSSVLRTARAGDKGTARHVRGHPLPFSECQRTQSPPVSPILAVLPSRLIYGAAVL